VAGETPGGEHVFVPPAAPVRKNHWGGRTREKKKKEKFQHPSASGNRIVDQKSSRPSCGLNRRGNENNEKTRFWVGLAAIQGKR